MIGSKKHEPIFAIITPTFNRFRYLGRAINSVISQTYPHWRLLIVDDGSTDNSYELIKTYSDKRILCFRSDCNQGHIRARNLALDQLPDEVDWVTELDSDDYLLPNALTTMVDKVEIFPNSRHFRFRSLWEKGSSASEYVEPGRLVSYEEKLTRKAPRGEWVVVVHRRFRDQGMRYNENLRRTPSVALSLRIYKQESCLHFPDVVRVMSKTPGSVSRPVIKGKNYYLEQIEVHKVFFDQFGEDLKSLNLREYKKKLKLFAQYCEDADLPYDEWPQYLKTAISHSSVPN